MKKANVSIEFEKSSNKYSVVINDNKFKTSNTGYIEHMYRKITGEKLTYAEISAVASGVELQSAQNKFDINTRFSFVEKLVRMVASGIQASAVITGQGGLGKTYTVNKTLKAAGYTDASELQEYEVGTVVNRSKMFVSVKGYTTAKGLYRTLFQNNGAVIIFDDCDSVFKCDIATNLLKGALDSHGEKRIISWNADMKDDDLPRSFNFTGKVIFISNLDQSKIDQAIRSRSMLIDLKMTSDQKIDRMEFIAKSEDFMPNFAMAHKMDAIALIRKLKDDAKEISLRTLISVTKIRSTNEDWADLAEYTLVA